MQAAQNRGGPTDVDESDGFAREETDVIQVLQHKSTFGCGFLQKIPADHTEEALEPLALVNRQEIAPGRGQRFAEFQADAAELRFIFMGREPDASEEVLSGQREIRRQENSQRWFVNLPND